MLSSNKDLQEFIKKGYVVNLNNPAWLANLPEAYRESIIREGGVYVYPFQVSTYGFIYNRDLYEKQQIGAPANYENFSNVIKSVHAQGGQLIAPSVRDQWPLGGMFEVAFSSILGDAQKNWLDSMNQGIGSFNISRINELENFFDTYTHYNKKHFNLSHHESLAMFENGNAFSILGSNQNQANFQRRQPDMKIGYYPLVVSNRSDASRLYSRIDTKLAINTHIGQKKIAIIKDFFSYLASSEAQNILIKEAHIVPPFKNMTSMPKGYYADIFRFINANKINIDMTEEWPSAVKQKAPQLLFRYLHGEISFDEVLLELDSSWRKALN